MPAIKRDHGLAMIRPSAISGPVVGLIFIVVPAFMLFGIIVGSSQTQHSTPQPLYIPIAFMSLFIIAGFFGTLNAWNSRYEVDDESLRRFDYLGRKRAEIRWGDVTAYEYSAVPVGQGGLIAALQIKRRSLKITAAGETISVPTYGYGWPLLEGEISHHLPQYKSPVGVAAGDLHRALPQTIPSNGFVFRMWPLVFITVFFGGFGGVISYIAITQPMNGLPAGSAQNQPLVFVGLFFVLLGMLAALYVVNGRTVLTETDIKTYNLFGQVVDQIIWSDAEALEYETTQSGKGGSTSYYILRSRDNYIRFNDRMSKWSFVRDTIIALLPPNARVYLPGIGIE